MWDDHRIAEGSTGIHDGDRSHAEVADALHLTNVVHKVEGTKGLPDKDNPMEPINKIHRFLKRFLRAHPNIDRRQLQDWLNLFCFIWNERGSPEDKAKSLILRMVSRRKIIRFRKEKAQSSDRRPFNPTRAI